MSPVLIGLAALGGFLAWIKGQGSIVPLPSPEQASDGSASSVRWGTAIYTWGLSGRTK